MNLDTQAMRLFALGLLVGFLLRELEENSHLKLKPIAFLQ